MTNEWPEKPRSNELGGNFRIIRTQASGETKGIIISAKHVGAETHYWRGRTVKCTREECEACLSGLEPRWHGHLWLYAPGTGETVIWEYPDKTHTAIEQYLGQYGSLRGASLTARRVGNKPNGRVYAALVQSARDVNSLPAEPDMVATLSRMWELKPNDPTQYTMAREALQAALTRKTGGQNGTKSD
jgi:hypothetical protein